MIKLAPLASRKKTNKLECLLLNKVHWKALGSNHSDGEWTEAVVSLTTPPPSDSFYWREDFFHPRSASREFNRQLCSDIRLQWPCHLTRTLPLFSQSRLSLPRLSHLELWAVLWYARTSSRKPSPQFVLRNVNTESMLPTPVSEHTRTQ